MKNDTPNKRLSISLDYRLIIGLLLVVIVAMFIIWKPWSPAVRDESRVIEVTGEATLKAEPDEYVFSPNYQFKNASKEQALKELTAKSEELISKLKELGVNDNQIKSNSNGYDYYGYYYDGRLRTNNYTLQLTITANDKELAQKVQDYLITTEPSGNISPRVTFSESKRKELENKARDEAAKDARAKAEQSGENLGFKIDGVKSVRDSLGFGGGYPEPYPIALDTKEQAQESQLTVQPGENELKYSVTVVYYLK